MNFKLKNKKGKSLSKLLEEEPSLEYSFVSMFLCQLILAVAYLHSNLILHSFINTRVIYVNSDMLKLGGLYFAEKLESKSGFGKQNRILEYDDNIDDINEGKIGLKYDTL